MQKKEKSTYQSSYRQLWAIILFGVSLILGVLTYFEGENFWSVLHKGFFGLFGASAYLIAPLCLLISILIAFEHSYLSVKSKVIEAVILIFLVSGAFHIFTSITPEGATFFSKLANLFTLGINVKGGGLSAAVFGWSLYALFGKKVAAIIIVIVILIFLMIVLGVTLKDVILTMKKPVEQLEQAYQEHIDQKAYELEQEEKYVDDDREIDISLGPDKPKNPKRSPNTIHEEADTPESKISKVRRAKIRLLGEEVDEYEEEETEQPKPEHEFIVDDIIEKPSEPEKEDISLSVDSEGQTSFYSDGVEDKIYKYPPLTLLNAPKIQRQSDGEEEIKQNAEILMNTLSSFGVNTRLLGATKGPAVTRYELQPSAGVRISKITQLSADIALNLAATNVRIEAPIPNKAAVGIEVPNSTVSQVTLREVLSSQSFKSSESSLEVALGKDISGNIITTDISKMPHLLIAGTTGSGKSVCTNSMIISLLYKSSPAQVRLLLIDPKMVEFSAYNGIPHLLIPVVTDPKKAAGALNWAVSEMENRYKLFAEYGTKDISSYNTLAEGSDNLSPLPKVVIIIDEFADLMMTALSDVEAAVCRLAQKARAAGMHLIIATQRPSVNVITGLIKANITSRIALTVSSQIDSRTIIDSSGAEALLGRGDMLFKPYGSDRMTRIQGCFVSEKEIADVITYIKADDSAEYDQKIIDEIERQAPKDKAQSTSCDDDDCEETDMLIRDAIECVIEAGQASVSLLQRRLKVGYSRAGRLIDQMEARGIVGEYEGSKPRKVLITHDQWVEMNMRESE